MNMANVLTTARVFFIPLFLYLFFADFSGHYYLAGSVFILSGITDYLDGYIARTHNITSKFGRLFDPLADKLSMITAFLSLAAVNLLPLWVILIILAREVAILSGSIFVFVTGNDIIFPTRYGKVSTFCLYAAVAASILGLKYVGYLFLAAAIPLTLYSAVEYIIKAYNHLFKNGRVK